MLVRVFIRESEVADYLVKIDDASKRYGIGDLLMGVISTPGHESRLCAKITAIYGQHVYFDVASHGVWHARRLGLVPVTLSAATLRWVDREVKAYLTEEQCNELWVASRAVFSQLHSCCLRAKTFEQLYSTSSGLKDVEDAVRYGMQLCEFKGFPLSDDYLRLMHAGSRMALWLSLARRLHGELVDYVWQRRVFIKQCESGTK